MFVSFSSEKVSLNLNYLQVVHAIFIRRLWMFNILKKILFSRFDTKALKN